MTLHIFNNREKEYMNWISENSNSYVINASKTSSNKFLKLHTSSCSSISISQDSHSENAFTGQKWIKVCANTIDELGLWVVDKGYTTFPDVCAKCKPHINVGDKKRMMSSVALSRVEKKKLDLSSSKYPKISTKTIISYDRDKNVVKKTLERANGNCEHCNADAPFSRLKDGTPYLEVHHKIMLSDGGEDTINNTIALCPNCHREMHYG